MMPPCRPGWRVSRSHLRAACQSLAAVLRDIAANRTGLVTLPRQIGQGAWVREFGKSGRAGKAAKSERTITSVELLSSPPESGSPWTHRACGKNRLALCGDFREARCLQTDEFPRPRRYAQPAALGGFCYFGFWVSASRKTG